MEISSSKVRCFLSTPFTNEYLAIRSEFAAMLEQFDIEVPRVEDTPSSRGISERSREMLRSCQVVIADVTDANPNVIYEVGLAHGIGLPVLLLTQSLDPPASDFLQDNYFLLYEPENIQQFKHKIVKWIDRYSRRGSK